MTISYEDWLAYVFDQHIAADQRWLFDWERGIDLDISDAQVLDFIQQLCNQLDDLAVFSDFELNQGLHYIFNNSCSNWVYCFKNTEIPLTKRLQVLKDLQAFYTTLFPQRCTPNNHSGRESQLDDFAFMWWDVSPINSWQGDAEANDFYKVILEVLQVGLKQTNWLVIKGALHGLGHLVHELPQATTLIDKWLATDPQVPEALLKYAQSARIGCIQ